MATDSAAIAKAAAHEAVRETFSKLGVDTESPESIEAFKDDLRFSRAIRKRAEQGTDAFFRLVFLAIAGAVLTALADHFGFGKPHS